MNEKSNPPPTIVDKYRVLRTLGRGGMAIVYEAEDSSSGDRLALKRLALENGEESAYVTRQFELEFYNLAHFAHPCVVKVFDYGRDEEKRPYYTMELLEGGDLRKLSPLPFWDCCKQLVDVCSVLSFLHSRRLVHRDVTPRNIRLTSQGRAKLIDFGTLSVVGPAKRIVGTPPFCAPETISGDHIDHRADLFSLGVTAYITLTGRLPYMARSFADLHDSWRTPPKPPSSYVREIPEALDHLVMSMLQLDRSLRPSGAPEVMQRLGAIADLQLSEDQIVRQAYLSMPTVVGRDRELLRIRKLLVRGMRSRGGAVLLSGESGMGRSRILSATVLEAKLLGLTVLRADATDIVEGDFSAARVILDQLVEVMPNIATKIHPDKLALLAQLTTAIKPSNKRKNENVSTATRSSSPPTTFRPRAELSVLRSRIQAALLELLLLASSERVLLIAVDDIHRLDEPSASLIALLVERSLNHRLVVVATADGEALAQPDESLRFIAGAASRISLRELTYQDTRKLLGSIFGEVPNLHLLADHLFRMSAGVPGVIMQLAQHLLEQGEVGYEAGAWVLPSGIREDALPRSLTDALAHKIEKLSPNAISALYVLATIPERTLSQEHLLQLSQIETTAHLMTALDELVVADLVLVDRACYRIAHGSIGKMLRFRIDEQSLHGLHLRLADLLEGLASHEIIVADQLVKAGELERATNLIVSMAPTMENQSIEHVIALNRTLPSGWRKTLWSLVAYCDQTGRPRRDRFEIQTVISKLSALTDSVATDEHCELINQVYRDSGLDIYQQLDPQLPEEQRLSRALELAQQRFDEAPEVERCYCPERAIPLLGQAVIQAVAVIGSGYDDVLQVKIPSIEPLAPLSPALQYVIHTVRTTQKIMTNCHHRAHEGFYDMIERLKQPDLCGFDPALHRYILLSLQYAMANIEVQYGMPSALGWADIIQTNPLFEVSACRIRFLYALASGDGEQAELFRNRYELLRIQNAPPPFVERHTSVFECACYAFVGDVGRLKQTLPEIESMTRKSTGWEPVLFWVRGLYQQLLGEHKRALEAFREGLAQAPPGKNGAHLFLAASYIETLIALNSASQACIEGEKFVAAADAADLGPLTYRLLEALAKAYAIKGEHARARQLADEAIDRLEAFDAYGLVLGGAYETRARVALSEGDEETFQENTEKCAMIYRADQQPMMAARYSTLLRLATRRENDDGGVQIRAVRDSTSISKFASSEMKTMDRRSERTFRTKKMESALKTMIEAATAVGGYLFTMQQKGPILSAKYGNYEPPAELRTNVESFLSAEIDSAQEVRLGAADTAAVDAPFCWVAEDGGRYFPSLITHNTETGTMINGVVILRSRDTNPVYAPYELCVALSKILEANTDVKTSLAAM